MVWRMGCASGKVGKEGFIRSDRLFVKKAIAPEVNLRDAYKESLL
ncbi:hypothetical protein [Nostoc sp. 'Peltigera membranacea cyanobiont' 210A]|nr:hypothetical protein [Nostoc sp. 'Peltigera membranacea cyanobiont' 210A]